MFVSNLELGPGNPFIRAALAVALTASAAAQISVTEFMYSGLDGEFIELTNVSASPVDLTGWSLDDQTNDPGTFDLSGAGVLASGASIVITDRLATNFGAAWGLSGVIVLGGNATAPIGRNDSIYVYDDLDQIVDLIEYGDEAFPGSVRTLGASAHTCTSAVGINDIYRWTLAEAGDAWSSVASTNGDIGSPGTHVVVDCPPIGTVYCTSPANSTGVTAALDVEGSPSIQLNDVLVRCSSMPQQSVGYFLVSMVPGNVAHPGGSTGTLCLGGAIGRYSSFAASSGSLGEITLNFDLTAVSQPTGPVSVMPGEAWHFQCWYRDSLLGFPTSNFSEAAEVTFR